ncbi:MAG: hypothetical protein J6M64_10775 [Oscillospiraceae bacterium]|nr:hypothetical protein [Oscillospiraceae bacterium]
MERREWAKTLKKQQRNDTKARIKEAILDMRANKVTITKTSLAEELGLSRQAMNADYIKEFLQSFVEFNPDLENVAPSQEIEYLKNEAAALRAKIKDLTAKNKQLKNDLALTKQQLNDTEKQYEYLLGQYQVEVGDKIIHF